MAVLMAACGGGSPLEPPQAPDPPSTAAEAEAAEAVTAAEETVAETMPAVKEDLPVVTAETTVTVPVVTAVEAVATATTTAEAVDAEALTTTTEALAPSTTSAVAGSEPSIEIVAPPTTVSENASIQVDESVRQQALEAMLRDLAPAQVVLASFFGAHDDKAAVDFCLKERNGDEEVYRHVQRVVDLTASGWEISGGFDIVVVDDLESCVASFN